MSMHDRCSVSAGPSRTLSMVGFTQNRQQPICCVGLRFTLRRAEYGSFHWRVSTCGAGADGTDRSLVDLRTRRSTTSPSQGGGRRSHPR